MFLASRISVEKPFQPPKGRSHLKKGGKDAYIMVNEEGESRGGLGHLSSEEFGCYLLIKLALPLSSFTPPAIITFG